MSTAIRMIGGAIALAAITIIGGTVAHAQTNQQLKWCDGKDGATPDLTISGCTAAIQSGKYVGTNLAVAFSNRGLAYNNKGQHDRAIQDYDQAIKLNPNYAKAFSNRGNAYDDKKQYDRAIQDFDQAIKLEPSAIRFYNRGVAYHNKGQYDRAIQDYDQGIKLNPNLAAAIKNRAAAIAAKNK